jgi:hypothetical protein
MSEGYRPGDIDIQECVLTNTNGRSMDIRGQARIIDVYESVAQPTIYGEIYVNDAIGLLRGFPIIGEEKLHLKFKTPGREVRDYHLHVFKVEDIQITEDNKTTTYTLKLCSDEDLTNATRQVNRRLNAGIDASIQGILSQELETKKNIDVEQTKGIDNHLISNITPLQAIDKLRHRAVSARNASSSYVFFEDTDGFHFKTLEGMIRASRRSAGDRVFFFDDNLDIEESQVRFRDILNFQQIRGHDTISQLQAGSFKNVIQKFDLLTGNYTTVEYKDEQFADIFAATGKSSTSQSSAFKQKHGKTTSVTKFIPFTTDHNEDTIQEKVGILHGFVEKIMQNMAVMYIYGDSNLKLGQVAAVTLTTGNALSQDRKTKTVSKSYMVSSIRHILRITDRSGYTQSVELINNSNDF